MSYKYYASFKDLAKNINPEWTLEDWFEWPPDIFLLVAQIINRTGVYKLCLIDTDWWNHKKWSNDFDRLSKLWVRDTSNRLLNKEEQNQLTQQKEFKKWFDLLKADWDAENPANLDHFRALGNLYPEDSTSESLRLKDLAKAMIFMYILADSSCSGLGLLGQPLNEEHLKHRIFMTVANLLLNNTGSLSTITKYHGVVLPKMRTPQSGLSSRSLGLHLTFHISEVEVIWRTFPRLEDSNKSLNILAVPYPRTVEATDFEIVHDIYQAVRYFRGKVDKDVDQGFITSLVLKALDLAKKRSSIDIVVFPEMALTHQQYELLLDTFKIVFEAEEKYIQLPMIVAGMVKKNIKHTGIYGQDETFHNEVRMGVYFAGKWYTTTQRKHHRWLLDRSQIQQYELEGHLAADRRWFEFSSIAQRRLTILAPNDWLALTALICEDLARQEPVGEVIRGIGPTLLMALLSDGPQITSRWSARYASVLADDPGTAVLSLTSLGMSARSKVPGSNALTPDSPATVVGLWKDMIRKWEELLFLKTSHALLFTVSATFEQEFTLDGRSDGGYASVFQLESVPPHQIVFDNQIISQDLTAKLSDLLPKDNPGEKRMNIRELSAVQYAVDAVLDILSSLDVKRSDPNPAFELILNLLQGITSPIDKKYKFRDRIVWVISEAWENPANIGIAASAGEKGTNQMHVTIDDLQQIIQSFEPKSFSTTTDLYRKLIDKCGYMLKDELRKDVSDHVPLSILYNIYNRVASWNPAEKACFQIRGMDLTRADLMKKKIIGHLNSKKTSA